MEQKVYSVKHLSVMSYLGKPDFIESGLWTKTKLEHFWHNFFIYKMVQASWNVWRPDFLAPGLLPGVQKPDLSRFWTFTIVLLNSLNNNYCTLNPLINNNSYLKQFEMLANAIWAGDEQDNKCIWGIIHKWRHAVLAIRLSTSLVTLNRPHAEFNKSDNALPLLAWQHFWTAP